MRAVLVDTGPLVARAGIQKALRLGLTLAALNTALWGLLLASRDSYTPEECSVLNDRHLRVDEQEARGAIVIITDQDQLLFRRPVHSGWSEPLHPKALILPNAVPFFLAGELAAPGRSYYPGPTCSQSYRAGVYFLLFAALQWFLVGAAAVLLVSGFRRLLRTSRQ